MNNASFLEKFNNCNLCPNQCNINRKTNIGKCGVKNKLIIAKANLHMWEEPIISGKNGSGTIFFSGCPLNCVFCQNKKISQDCFGKEISTSRFADIFKELEDKGANNINFVTPTHFVPLIIDALDKYMPKIPILYNSSGYENLETLKMLNGYIDIYLPDLKYASNCIALKYSNVENYVENNFKTISEMISQVGKPKIENGLMKKGVIIRHLVLPNNTNDTIKVLEIISKNFKDEALVSIMSQYTPLNVENYPELNRKISPLEYKRVLRYMEKVGIENGFIQELDSSSTKFIPDFDLQGV